MLVPVALNLHGGSAPQPPASPVAAAPLASDEGKSGFYFCAAMLLASCLSLFLVDWHKSRIRR